MSTEPSALPSSPATSPADDRRAIRRTDCEWCKGPLSGRQERFCGKRCSNEWYELHRPRIANAAAGHPREGSIKAIILATLHDYEFHSLSDLAAAAKCSDASASARVRELRKHFKIDRDQARGSSVRQHRYRLVRG